MTLAKNQILFTQGKDPSGSLIFANDAEKGLDYFCPLCNTEFILRKSGNTGKGSKRPHFAHKNLTVNCTPETVLHFLFKKQAYELLKRHIEENVHLNFSWDCKYCGKKHSGNLLKKAKGVELEFNLGSCIPDIALLDENEKVFAVIEVVVTHAPEETTLRFYKDNKIILIQINLENELQLENIENKLTNPDVVEFCINPKCKKCGSYLLKKKMIIVDASCYRCKKQMKVAGIYSQDGRIMRSESTHLPPSSFNKDEIDFARSKGVNLALQYSSTTKMKYLANTCNHCKAFVGDFYTFDEYYAPAFYGDLPSTKYDIGYFCRNCSEVDMFKFEEGGVNK
jgi:hypothetical protein